VGVVGEVPLYGEGTRGKGGREEIQERHRKELMGASDPREKGAPVPRRVLTMRKSESRHLRGNESGFDRGRRFRNLVAGSVGWSG